MTALPAETLEEPLPVGTVFLLEHRPARRAPEVRPIGPAETSARLYANALNALGHPHHGLDAVVRIAQHLPSYAVTSSEFAPTCALLAATIEEAFATRA